MATLRERIERRAEIAERKLNELTLRDAGGPSSPEREAWMARHHALQDVLALIEDEEELASERDEARTQKEVEINTLVRANLKDLLDKRICLGVEDVVRTMARVMDVMDKIRTFESDITKDVALLVDCADALHN